MRATAFAVAMLLALLPTEALADVPGLINYQGTLTDEYGVAVDTTVDMTFSITSDSAGFDLIWGETQPAIEVSDGIFHVLLGRVVGFADTVFTEPERWLGVQVGADSELAPRQRIASVPFALAAGLGGGGSDGDWTISGDDLYSAVPGSVGIGTVSPAARLDIRGTFHVGEDGAGHDVNLFGSGSGSRLFWDESEMALRAGRDYDGTHWHPDSVGRYSLASGYNTKAIGDKSTALGQETVARGENSLAVGRETIAGGYGSMAGGRGAVAGGDYSTSLGWETSASGDYSTAMGYQSAASGFASFALGTWLRAGPANCAIAMGRGVSVSDSLINDVENSLMVGFNTNTPTLFVGGGDHRVGVGTSSPDEKLHVVGNIKMVDGNEASGKVLTSDAAGRGTWQTPSLDDDWTRGTPDSVLFTANLLGIARGGAGNVLYGSEVQTHINFGVACTTGTSSIDYSYCTVGGGYLNSAKAAYGTVGGGLGNYAGVYATVGGGNSDTASGNWASVGGGRWNAATGEYARAGGGMENTAGNDYATVSGGYRNVASGLYTNVAGGEADTASGPHATVSGGKENTASDDFATVGGGRNNTASGWGATVSAGITCTASGSYSVVSGGWENTASGWTATIAGGHDNTAGGSYAFIGGGFYNRTTENYAFVGGGYADTASGVSAAIAGGIYNSATADYATVTGGYHNTADSVYSAIVGGENNTTEGDYAFVGGGRNNTASGTRATLSGGEANAVTGDWALVGGGYADTASGKYATIGGGLENTASQSYATVGGGYGNTAKGKYAATVAGGKDNLASGWYSTVAGGENNTASGYMSIVGGGYADTSSGYYSFSVGNQSLAAHDNSAAFNGQATTASGQTRVGTLSKAAGTFTIDHPLDPMNKILNHYFIESPEMVLIYRGAARIGADGRAEVHLPDYFDALNQNPMVQLTGVGTAEVVYVAQEVEGNSFVIGGKPGTKVYWTVTGERKDPSAEITRILMPVEQPKDGELAGRSLDDDYLAATMRQLEQMGRAGRFGFRTQEGRARYEASQRALTEN